MSSKQAIWIFMTIGSAVGGYLPLLWGSDFMSLSSVFLTAVGGLLGIWFGYKITH